MEELTLRQFRTNISHYIELMSGGATFLVNGVEIGKITEKRVHTPSLKNETAIISQPSVYTPVVTLCQKCKMNPALFSFFQDGEDYVACQNCLKKHGIKNFKPL
jgi:hypothetical protein